MSSTPIADTRELHRLLGQLRKSTLICSWYVLLTYRKKFMGDFGTGPVIRTQLHVKFYTRNQ